MKKIIPLFILALFLFGCLLPWGGSKDEFEMVPKTANAVIILKPSSLLNDSDFNSLYSSSTEMNDEMKRAEETTGMDPRKIDRIVLFFKLDSLSQESETYGGFIARGTIDKDKILEKMKLNNIVTEMSYSSRVMYEISSKEMPQNKSYFSFIGADILIGGTKKAVEDSIDLDSGKGESVKSRGNLSKLYDKFDKNSIFMLLIESSQDMKESMSETTGAPLNIKALSHMDSLGLSVKKVQKSIDFKLMVLADDAAGASGISNLFEKSVSLAKGVSESGSSIENILTKLKIETTGVEVSVSISSTADELEKAYDELYDVSSLIE